MRAPMRSVLPGVLVLLAGCQPERMRPGDTVWRFSVDTAGVAIGDTARTTAGVIASALATSGAADLTGRPIRLLFSCQAGKFMASFHLADWADPNEPVRARLDTLPPLRWVGAVGPAPYNNGIYTTNPGWLWGALAHASTFRLAYTTTGGTERVATFALPGMAPFREPFAAACRAQGGRTNPFRPTP